MPDVTAPPFRALDRGIAMASLYVATLIAWAELWGPGDLHAVLRATSWAVCGFLAGAIAGFRDADRRGNVRDAVMIVLWTANLLLAVNVFVQLGRLAELAVLLAWLAAAALLGAVAGEPLLLGIALLSVRHRNPRNVRFVARVLLHTLVVAVLLAIAAATAFGVFVVFLLVLGGLTFYFLLGVLRS